MVVQGRWAGRPGRCGSSQPTDIATYGVMDWCICPFFTKKPLPYTHDIATMPARGAFKTAWFHVLDLSILFRRNFVNIIIGMIPICIAFFLLFIPIVVAT